MGAVTKIREALAIAIPSLAESSAAIEQKIIDVVGTYADSEALERENTLNVINRALAEQKVTTVDYYRKKASEYQQGDALSYDSVNFGAFYETVDPDKQIVKSVYIVGRHPEYSLLVNKVDTATGRLTTLTEAELNGFKAYFAAFQPIGLNLTINSLPVARIYDSSLTIYVEAGTDANEAAQQINANLIAAESKYRPLNALSMTEIADIIQQFAGVRAVYFGNPYAKETGLDGQSETTVYPDRGIFRLTTGAFTFATEVTTDMIKILE